MSIFVTKCKVHGDRTLEEARKIKRYLKNKIWHGYRCKICVDASKKIRNKRNYEYNEKEKEKNLKKKFGINISQYNMMVKIQNNVCAICKKPETARANPNIKNIKSLSVDHCHKTGKIRGLLCCNCNMLLGYAKDSIETLKSAIIYLSASYSEADFCGLWCL